jgi:arsenite methyltransferase
MAKGCNSDAEAVRAAVARDYGRAVSRCCAGGADAACSVAPEQIGYTSDDMAHLPESADAPTFGCGNPLAFSEVAKGDTVLDLGSGAGLDLLIAAERVGPGGRVIGVDMTDEMIARARANVAAAGHANVEVRRGLIEELPVESATVDWVVSNCVINLSPEKGRVFAEIARVLKPGGRALISDMVVDDLPDEVRRSVAALVACVGGAISEAEYVRGLREAGLVDLEVRARVEYTPDQIAAVAPGLADGGGCCCSAGAAEGSISLGDARVASIQVYARKPSGA